MWNSMVLLTFLQYIKSVLLARRRKKERKKKKKQERNPNKQNPVHLLWNVMSYIKHFQESVFLSKINGKEFLSQICHNFTVNQYCLGVQFSPQRQNKDCKILHRHPTNKVLQGIVLLLKTNKQWWVCQVFPLFTCTQAPKYWAWSPHPGDHVRTSSPDPPRLVYIKAQQPHTDPEVKHELTDFLDNRSIRDRIDNFGLAKFPGSKPGTPAFCIWIVEAIVTR